MTRHIIEVDITNVSRKEVEELRDYLTEDSWKWAEYMRVDTNE